MELAIAYAVPVFFLLMGVELLIARDRYALADTITNLSCGVGQQLIGVLFKALIFVGYVTVHRHTAVFDLGFGTWYGWGIALLGTDLCYYWAHRAGHRVNAVWATHVTHHQSEEMNLSVALRQTWFGLFLVWPFYLPLAVLGVDPLLFLAANTIMTLYQFWIHTELIDRLGPLEWVFNTPSHHRVHHGVNPEYVDTNYGGILIVWDRLFGTFAAEGERPTYGTVEPLRSWNPLWANLAVWAKIVRLARASTRLRDRVWAFFAPPEWRPAEAGGPVTVPPVPAEGRPKFAVPGLLRGPAVYVATQFLLLVGSSTALLVVHRQLALFEKAAWVGASVAGLVALGALLERRRWGLPLEGGRLVVTGVGAGVASGHVLPALAVAGAMLIALAVAYRGPDSRRAPQPGQVEEPAGIGASQSTHSVAVSGAIGASSGASGLSA